MDDRAYRIAHSAGQVRVDRFSVFGGLIGGTLAVLLFPLGLSGVISGLGTGVAGGVAVHMVGKERLDEAIDKIKQLTK